MVRLTAHGLLLGLFTQFLLLLLLKVFLLSLGVKSIELSITLSLPSLVTL